MTEEDAPPPRAHRATYLTGPVRPNGGTVYVLHGGIGWGPRPQLVDETLRRHHDRPDAGHH